MSDWTVVLGVILVFACAVLGTIFIRAYHAKRYVLALIFKGAASLCFVTFGAINCFVNSPSHTSLIIFIGLCFGFIGDEFIALCQVCPRRDDAAFVSGGVAFFTGHFLYVVALFSFGEINPWIIIISAFVLSALGGLYERWNDFLSGKMKLNLFVYLGIVILMSSVALNVFINRLTLGAALFLLGGLLFVVSDNVLFAFKFGRRPKFSQNIILHLTYYLAQFAIAFSMAII